MTANGGLRCDPERGCPIVAAALTRMSLWTRLGHCNIANPCESRILWDCIQLLVQNAAMSVRDRDAFGPGDQASRTELPSIRALTYPGPRARARARKLQLEMQTLRVLRDLPPTWTVTVQGRGRRRTVANLKRLMIESGYRLADRSTGRTKMTDAETNLKWSKSPATRQRADASTGSVAALNASPPDLCGVGRRRKHPRMLHFSWNLIIGRSHAGLPGERGRQLRQLCLRPQQPDGQVRRPLDKP